MEELKQAIKKDYFQITVIGSLWLIVGGFLFLIGLLAILSIDNNAILGIYLIVVLMFTIINFIHTFLLNKQTLANREQEYTNHQTLKKNERSINQLQVAAEIARDATSQADLQGVLDRAVQLICERFDFYHAGIFLIDDETQYAVLRAACGVDASMGMLKRGHKLKVGQEGIVGFVTETGQPRIVLDTDEDTYHYKNPVLPETRSELALPFRVGDRIIGALDVQSVQRGAFDQDDVNILQTMTDLLAVAIEKANLNERVQAYAEELEVRVQQRTQQLETEHAQLQAILNSMSDGLIYDEKLNVIYTNKALTKLTGFNSGDWKGLLQLLKPESMSQRELDALEQELFDGVGKHGIWTKDMKLKRADGSEFDASIICTGVQHDPINNTAKGAVTIIRDISQRKALDEQKSRFIANAAHELRTPLSNMKTRLYLIRHQPERFGEHYDILRSVTARMQRLIDDLLDMSRFERGKINLSRKKHNLQALVHDVVMTQRPEAEAKSIQLLENFAETPLFAEIDLDRMTQVLTNLISNAINYTEKGKITVHLNSLSNLEVEICVEDTGIGIKPDMLESIFQPFVRGNHDTTSKGTGLGLNIARDIINLHDGQLEVESIYGKGSKFYVRLQQAEDTLSVC